MDYVSFYTPCITITLIEILVTYINQYIGKSKYGTYKSICTIIFLVNFLKKASLHQFRLYSLIDCRYMRFNFRILLIYPHYLLPTPSTEVLSGNFKPILGTCMLFKLVPVTLI